MLCIIKKHVLCSITFLSKMR